MENPTVSTLKVVQRTAFNELIKKYTSNVFNNSISISKEDLINKVNIVANLAVMKGIVSNDIFSIVDAKAEELFSNENVLEENLEINTVIELVNVIETISTESDANQLSTLIEEKLVIDKKISEFAAKLNKPVNTALESFNLILSEIK